MSFNAKDNEEEALESKAAGHDVVSHMHCRYGRGVRYQEFIKSLFICEVWVTHAFARRNILHPGRCSCILGSSRMSSSTILIAQYHA